MSVLLDARAHGYPDAMGLETVRSTLRSYCGVLEVGDDGGRRAALRRGPAAPRARVRRDDRALPCLLQPVRASLQANRRLLLEKYRFRDVARKVVGVGSVGLRAFVALLQGRGDPGADQSERLESAVKKGEVAAAFV